MGAKKVYIKHVVLERATRHDRGKNKVWQIFDPGARDPAAKREYSCWITLTLDTLFLPLAHQEIAVLTVKDATKPWSRAGCCQKDSTARSS